jgi:hypothetical protein
LLRYPLHVVVTARARSGGVRAVRIDEVLGKGDEVVSFEVVHE